MDINDIVVIEKNGKKSLYKVIGFEGPSLVLSELKVKPKADNHLKIGLQSSNLTEFKDFIFKLNPETEHDIEFIQSDGTVFSLIVPACPDSNCDEKMLFGKLSENKEFEVICSEKYAEDLVECINKKLF